MHVVSKDLAVSTAVCEKGFSSMKIVKSDMRATLSDQNISSCRTVLLESATIEVFNLQPALELQWEAKLRRLGGEGRGKMRRRKRVVSCEE